MSSSSNASIAKKVGKKAGAEFVTLLMMAKLGGFDELPSNARAKTQENDLGSPEACLRSFPIAKMET
jgi:hypothetical protein